MLQSQEKCTVVSCASGEAALETLPDFQPDLILVDCLMPGMDGLQTIQALRERMDLSAARVIFATGIDDQDRIEELREAGAAVNDQHGHQVGDVVIRSLASLLRQRRRAIDGVGRLGDEEFLAVLSNCSATQALSIVDGVREAFGKIDFAGCDGPFRSSFSAGGRIRRPCRDCQRVARPGRQGDVSRQETGPRPGAMRARAPASGQVAGRVVVRIFRDQLKQHRTARRDEEHPFSCTPRDSDRDCIRAMAGP